MSCGIILSNIYLVSYMCQDENRRQIAELIRAHFTIKEQSRRLYENYSLLLASNPSLLNLDAGSIWIVMWDDSPLSFGRSGQEFFLRIVSLNTFFVVYGREYWKEEVLMEHAEKRIGSMYCDKDGIMDRHKLHEHVFAIENDESSEVERLIEAISKRRQEIKQAFFHHDIFGL